MKFLTSLLALSCCIPTLSAAPFIPAQDEIILERLPYKANDPLSKRSVMLRAALQRAPTDPKAAAALAQSYYDIGVNNGDPRFISYAEAALRPWWKLDQPPLVIATMRAAIHQYRHEFSKALNDLSIVLKANPHDPTALALRSAIYMVQARYLDARADCKALAGNASPLIAEACLASINALTGGQVKAYNDLMAAYQRFPSAPAEEKLWVLTRLAEMQQRMGDLTRADEHYREALNLGITQVFLLASYADLLLEQGRADAALALLKDKPTSDGLLLRQALAARTLRTPEATGLAKTLRARFAAASLRGDKTHQQEEAKFALDIEGLPMNPVQLASENWQVQREPRDALILLEAALANRNAKAAQPVFAWMAESGIEDKRLIKLKQQIDATLTLP